MRPEPRHLANRTCAECKGERPEQAGSDPFCSTQCCRAYYGCLPAREFQRQKPLGTRDLKPEAREKQRARNRKARERGRKGVAA
jgi:hypothetical protein